MIILICDRCLDTLTLTRKERRECGCGLSFGYYEGRQVHVSPHSVPLGVSNESLKNAMHHRPTASVESTGSPVEARVLARDYFTVDHAYLRLAQQREDEDEQS